jgi:acetyl esterase/lipase
MAEFHKQRRATHSGIRDSPEPMPIIAPEPETPGALRVPARIIPVPKSISPEAQQFLVQAGSMQQSPPAEPSPSDKEAWRKHIAGMDKMFDPMIDRLLGNPARVERRNMGGASVCVGTPDVVRHPDRARMTIHGGAWTLLGGRYVMGEAAEAAAEAGCMAFAVDYRMPPDFPFPAGLDDCVAAYREIIKTYDPKKVVISGPSAGANLAAAVTLKIRDLGLPLPGAVGMMSIPADLTGLGDTLQTNRAVDLMLPRPLDSVIALYAGGHDLTDPYLSPMFGDFTKGFPPAFLQSGTRDVLLSDTVRLHRKLVHAGIPAELHVWEAMPHASFGQSAAPENREIHTSFLEFVEKHLNRG